MDKSGNYKKVRVSALKNYNEIDTEAARLIAIDCKLNLQSRLSTVKSFRIILEDGTVYKFDTTKLKNIGGYFELAKTGEVYEWDINNYKAGGR